jgi:GTPase SAR1 family protein
MKTASVILVGTKSDFRDAPPAGVDMVTKEAVCRNPLLLLLRFFSHVLFFCSTSFQAEDMVRKLKLTQYVECSARTQQNLTAVFEAAARVVISKSNAPAKSEGGCCTVL